MASLLQIFFSHPFYFSSSTLLPVFLIRGHISTKGKGKQERSLLHRRQTLPLSPFFCVVSFFLFLCHLPHLFIRCSIYIFRPLNEPQGLSSSFSICRLPIFPCIACLSYSVTYYTLLPPKSLQWFGHDRKRLGSCKDGTTGHDFCLEEKQIIDLLQPFTFRYCPQYLRQAVFVKTLNGINQ